MSTGKDAEDSVKTKHTGWRRCTDIFDRKTYWGSFAFNLIAALLPALYTTLSRLWVARIDQSHLSTTSLYEYLGSIASILNDGLPRVVWLVIGDGTTRSPASRLELAYTLIGVQAMFGTILTLVFIGAAPFFAKSFMSADIWASSVRYVQICAPVALCSLVTTATGHSTRALDQPDVSVMISVCSAIANIVLDFLLISNFRVPWVTPSIHLQAGIQLACNSLGALAGLMWFAWNVRRLRRKGEVKHVRILPTWRALKVLLRPATWMFLESLTRNAVALWVASRIAFLGNVYVTAWGVFSHTIRWGLIMVPASAWYSSGSTFVGHKWAQWRGRSDPSRRRPVATWEDLRKIVGPALQSMLGALVVEVIFCIAFSIGGMWQFAYFISTSSEVADIVLELWRNIEWCYVFFAVGWQAGTILLASVPRWNFYANLTSNVVWMLPWGAVLTVTTSPLHDPKAAWRLFTICYGGAVVVDSLSIAAYLAGWAWSLTRGKIDVTPVERELPSSGPSSSVELEELRG